MSMNTKWTRERAEELWKWQQVFPGAGDDQYFEDHLIRKEIESGPLFRGAIEKTSQIDAREAYEQYRPPGAPHFSELTRQARKPSPQVVEPPKDLLKLTDISGALEYALKSLGVDTSNVEIGGALDLFKEVGEFVRNDMAERILEKREKDVLELMKAYFCEREDAETFEDVQLIWKMRKINERLHKLPPWQQEATLIEGINLYRRKLQAEIQGLPAPSGSLKSADQLFYEELAKRQRRGL